jgi:hypothetical protein
MPTLEAHASARVEGHDSKNEHSNKVVDEVHRELREGKREERDVGAPAEGAEAAKMLEGFAVVDESQSQNTDDPEKVNAKKQELQEKYGVIFDTKESLPEKEQQFHREPTLAELEVMDKVLNKSPELRKEEVHLSFQNDTTNGNLADHQEVRPGVTRITVRKADLNPVMYDTKEGPTSRGSVLLHELGHQADHVAPRDNEALGWKPAGLNQHGQQEYALETTDGRLYKYVGANDDPDKKGYWQKVDAGGNPTTDQADSKITDAEMQSLAKVKQPMHPASAPAETFANAIRMYRQDEKTRAELKEKSPEIYAYIEEYDRKQVNSMGRDFFGIAENERNEQGDIVRNSQSWNPVLM